MIVSFMIEIDSETGYPKWFHSPQEKLLTGQALVTLNSLHTRYKALQREVESRVPEDSNPTIPTQSRQPDVLH